MKKKNMQVNGTHSIYTSLPVFALPLLLLLPLRT